VLIRDNGREAELYGHLQRKGVEACESQAMQGAMRAIQRMQTPLLAIETTIEVKRALIDADHFDGPIRRSLWEAARRWWRSECREVGLRVKRRPGDTYSGALNRAELAATTGCSKLKPTREELETPGNRLLRVQRAYERAVGRAEREQRKAQRIEDGADDYARAAGAGQRSFMPQPAQSAAREQGLSIEEMEVVITQIEQQAKSQNGLSDPVTPADPRENEPNPGADEEHESHRKAL
jgi:hypothetical protein